MGLAACQELNGLAQGVAGISGILIVEKSGEIIVCSGTSIVPALRLRTGSDLGILYSGIAVGVITAGDYYIFGLGLKVCGPGSILPKRPKKN